MRFGKDCEMEAILATQLQTWATELGFARVGWTVIEPSPAFHTHFATWLAQHRHGDMHWMARNAERRLDPTLIIPHARTIISVSTNYYTPEPHSSDARHGRISRYAWGDDYHEIILPRLTQFLGRLHTHDPTIEGIAYVDTGPVLEKPWAARAGLGWQGKHTNLIDPHRGSWLFLGEIITTAVIDEAPRTATPTSRCGTCTKCIDVCPTRAITAPYQLDATRCISYLTIEHKGSIPVALRPLLGNHIYGCDLCQDVCPWNRFATPTPDPAFHPRAENLNPVLSDLMAMTDAEFRTRFRHSPIKRIKRNRFLRNVAVALGNSKDPAALPSLRRACEDPDPLIQEHAHWAIGAITG